MEKVDTVLPMKKPDIHWGVQNEKIGMGSSIIRNYIDGFVYMGFNYLSRITNISSYVAARNIRYG